MQSSQITKLFQNLQSFSKRTSDQLIQSINQIKIDNLQQIEAFNNNIQKQINKVYIKLMTQSNYQDLSSLLGTLFLALNKKQFKEIIVITLMDNILQCVGVTDLQLILKIFSQNLHAYRDLCENDQNKLLKIINHLLKRVSKSQDYFIRGQLHLALTKILPLCHDSGFHRKGVPAKASQIQPQNQMFSEINNQGQISYEFYQSFWGLQKFFMNPNELETDQQYLKLDKQDSKKSANNITPHKRLFLLNLRKINNTLKEIIDYFKIHPVSQTQQLESQNQPIKFLKIFHLLPLQLNDKYFRVIILIQILIFCYSLKNPSTKITFLLSEEEKSVINQIEKIGIDHLNEITKKSQNSQLYQNFCNFLKNQIQWVQLKDNWKQMKKSFILPPSQQIKSLKQKGNFKKSQQTQLSMKRSQAQRQFTEKMGLDGTNLQYFIHKKKLFALKNSAIIPSFQTYFGQADEALSSFNQKTGAQQQFETKSQYNLFQWKAMRALFRENLHQLNLVQKNNTKLKQYRLLSIINSKQEDFYDEPRKKIKPNQDIQ